MNKHIRILGECLALALMGVVAYALLCMAPGLEALIIEAKHLN